MSDGDVLLFTLSSNTFWPSVLLLGDSSSLPSVPVGGNPLLAFIFWLDSNSVNSRIFKLSLEHLGGDSAAMDSAGLSSLITDPVMSLFDGTCVYSMCSVYVRIFLLSVAILRLVRAVSMSSMVAGCSLNERRPSAVGNDSVDLPSDTFLCGVDGGVDG